MFIVTLFTIAKLRKKTKFSSTNEWVDKENVLYMYNSVQEGGNYVVFRKMDRTGNCHVKQNKPDLKRQVAHFLSHVEFRKT
jgi:hypothetical protein